MKKLTDLEKAKIVLLDKNYSLKELASRTSMSTQTLANYRHDTSHIDRMNAYSINGLANLYNEQKRFEQYKYFTARNIFDIYLSKIENIEGCDFKRSIMEIFDNADQPIFGNEDEGDDEEDTLYFGEAQSYQAVQELASSFPDGIFDLITIACEMINAEYDDEKKALEREYQGQERDEYYDMKSGNIESNREFYLDYYTRNSRNLANYFMRNAAEYFLIHATFQSKDLKLEDLKVSESNLPKVEKALDQYAKYAPVKVYHVIPVER